MGRIAIIGSGLAGLGAAWQLEQEKRSGVELTYEIFERESRPGGLCRTEERDGFLFDYTGHLLHFRTDFFRELVFSLLGPHLQQRQRSAWIYSKGVYTRYPFQANLFGLPPDVIVECVYEFSRAHFGQQGREICSFEDWILTHFGSGIAEHFMIPYNSKLYRCHPREMTPDCMGRFVPDSDLHRLLRGALTDASDGLGYNAVFHYPVSGGIETLIRSLVPLVASVRTGEAVVKVRPEDRTLVTGAGKEVRYDTLISTQPLPSLVDAIEGTPEELRAAAGSLKHVSVLNINLGIRGNLGERHWVYVPEPEFPFHRVGFPHNFSAAMAPEGCGSLYLEISYDPAQGIDREEAYLHTVASLLKMGILRRESDILVRCTVDMPYGYVVFDRQRQSGVSTIRRYLDERRIYSVGRFGSWTYASMEDAFMDGRHAAIRAAGSSGNRKSVHWTSKARRGKS